MGSSSKSTTENKPPAWAKPLFEQSAREATNLYNSGVGGNVYTGSTVAPLSGTTMSGIQQLATTGANTSTDQTRPIFQGLGAASLGPSYSESNLGDVANGTFLRNGNPYFNAALQGQLDDTAAQVQSQFAGAGRYGSGANTGVLANSLGNIRSSALFNQFNADADRMLSANSQMDAARNAGLDRALNATGAMAQQDQQQFLNAMSGADATLRAGGLLDQQAQRNLNDQVNLFYALDNADWNRLGMLQQAAAGAAGPYGTQNSRTSSSNPLAAVGAVGSMFGGK